MKSGTIEIRKCIEKSFENELENKASMILEGQQEHLAPIFYVPWVGLKSRDQEGNVLSDLAIFAYCSVMPLLWLASLSRVV